MSPVLCPRPVLSPVLSTVLCPVICPVLCPLSCMSSLFSLGPALVCPLEAYSRISLLLLDEHGSVERVCVERVCVCV